MLGYSLLLQATQMVCFFINIPKHVAVMNTAMQMTIARMNITHAEWD